MSLALAAAPLSKERLQIQGGRQPFKHTRYQDQGGLQKHGRDEHDKKTTNFVHYCDPQRKVCSGFFCHYDVQLIQRRSRLSSHPPNPPHERGYLFNMRLLPISILYALFASIVIAESSEQTLGSNEVPGEISEGVVADGPEPTIFNGIQVPPLPDIEGEKFNETVKEGYWFVKHHS